MSEYNFIINYFHMNELKEYYEPLDIENIFNNLSEDIKNDLVLVTNALYNAFSKKLKNLKQYSLTLDGLESIDGFNCYIQIYVNNLQPELNSKIGLSVNNNSDYSNFDTFQNIIYTDLNVNCENNFKNHIYNILFFSHLIIKEYKYSPLFYNFYHKNDIIEMNNIRKRNIKLFGKYEECCVCYDQTVKKTICNHSLCLRCLNKIPINNKTCPMCRAFLSIEDEMNYDNVQSATIFIQRDV